MEKTQMNMGASSPLRRFSVSLDKVSFGFLFALLALIPIFVIPSGSVDVLYSKMLLLILCTLVPLVLVIFSSIRTGHLLIPSWRTALAILVVPVAVLIASFVSPNAMTSLIGGGFEYDTAHFTILGFLIISLVAAVFQSKQRIFWSYFAFLGIFGLVSIFHVLRFIGGPTFLNLGGSFSSVVSNTIGTWNDLGTYAGLAIILSFVTIELVEFGRSLKAAFYAVLCLGLIVLAVTNFYVVFGQSGISISLTALVGFIALLIFVYVISQNYKSSTRKLPVAALIVLVFCVVMTVAASPIASYVYSKVGITQNDVLDVRPTIFGTFSVAEQMISKEGITHSLFGLGPNRFFAVWNLYKPQGVNQTVFWNTDFNYGTGYILTSLVTTGIVGFLAWIVFLLFTLGAGVRSVFAVSKDKFSVYLITSSLLSSLYLWFMMIFYNASPVILIFAFFFTGLLSASLVREKFISLKEFSWVSSQKKGFAVVLVLILIFIGTVAWGFSWAQRFVASIDAKKASIVLKTPADLPQAEALTGAAIQRVPSYDLYLRSFSQLKLLELQVALQNSGSTELSTSSAVILNQAALAVTEATRLNQFDYRNVLLLGSVYEAAGLLGVQGAGDTAVSAYQEVQRLNPSNPLPAYLTARLFAFARDSARAKDFVQRALALKPDFQEANTLLSQIQNIPSSGNRAETTPAVQTTSSPAQKAAPKATSTKNQ